MKLKINKETCIGCSTCALLAPDSFKMDDDGKASVLDVVGDDEATVKSAVDSCPVKAISLE